MKNSILFTVAAILLFQLVARPAPQQAPKAKIEGSIMRLGSGEPVAGARLTLSRSGRGAVPAAAPVAPPAGARAGAPVPPTPPKPIPFAVTDDQGNFAFQDLDEGSYTLQILGNGYVSLNYGQRYMNGPGTPIALKAGQDLKDLTISLTPASNISGRIRDRSDQPLSNVPVQLMRYSYDAQGQRTYQNVGAAKTNDRGEYRIYWMTPGRYYLMAGNPSYVSPLVQMLIMMDSGTANPNEVPVTLGYAFYPGVSDIGSARPIDLQPGADLDSVNMTLSPRPPAFTIRGRVIDSRTGQPPAKARIAASSRTPGIGSGGILDEVGLALPINNNYNSANGTFEIRDLLPGSYLVTAMAQDPVPAAAAGGRGEPSQPPTASVGITTVAVADSDVEGQIVTVFPAAPMVGRIRADGQQQLPVTPDRLRVQLINRTPGSSAIAAAGLVSSLGSSSATPAADGTFRFQNVAPGDYRITVQSLGAVSPTGARGGSIYIKEARFDSADVINGPLRITGSASGALDIVVGVGSGQVTGVLNDNRSKPVPVSQVVLVPDRFRDRWDLYKTATTDDNGKYNFFGIVPGDYKLFSWDGLDPFGWFDPDVMAKSETRGHAVHVTDTSTETIDLTLIPKEGAQ